jgi:hypothetical protein
MNVKNMAQLVLTRKAWIGFAAGVAIAVCAWTAAHWERFRPYDWKQVVSQDRQFRISFPGNPTTSQEDSTASDGSKFVSNWLKSSPTRGVIYALAWWENPAQENKSTNELFSDFRECNIKAFHGNIVGERELDVQGYPAKMTVVFAPNTLVVENLVIRVGPRLYSLSVLDSTGRLDVSNIKKFFASLSLHQT